MKKLITLLLAASLLAASVPASFAGDSLDALTLDSASPLVIADDGYIDNMPDGITAAELIANFKDKKNVTVTDKSGKALSLADAVGSDAVVSYVSGEVTAKTWMLGDVNGDAGISAKDPAVLVRKQAGFGTDLCERASDVNGDSAVNAKDVATLMKYLAGWEIVIEKPAYAGEVAPNEDAGIGMYFTSIMNRVGRSDTTNHGSLDYIARMAKGEIEDIEIVLTSDADKAGMTLEVGDLVNESGAKLDYTLHRGYYYEFDMFNQLKGKDYSNVTKDFWVEPLLPLDGAFDLTAGQSYTFAIRITSTADSEAGFYKAPLFVKDSAGNVVKQGTLRVYVWDIVLDETPALDTAFCLDYGRLLPYIDDDWDKVIHMTYEEIRPTYELWYEYLLENHMSAYDMPYGNHPDNDKYVHDPRVTSFKAVGGGLDSLTNATCVVPDMSFEQMAELWKAHADDPDWLAKAYIYDVDEPSTDWQIDFLEDQWNTLKSLIPDIPFRVVCPLAGNHMNQNDPEAKDYLDRLGDCTNIICPGAQAFNQFITKDDRKAAPDLWPSYYDTDGFTNRFIFNKYGDFSDRYEALREEGKTMWSYICIGPQFPYANFFTYYQGVDVRMVLWQTYQHHSDGLLYWAVNYWQRDEKDPTPITLRRTHVSGDGLLIYPAKMYGCPDNIPAPSIRFEDIRDGIEDYQLLAQLEREIGRKAVLGYVERISTHKLCFSEDPDDMISARNDLAFMLESVSGK